MSILANRILNVVFTLLIFHSKNTNRDKSKLKRQNFCERKRMFHVTGITIRLLFKIKQRQPSGATLVHPFARQLRHFFSRCQPYTTGAHGGGTSFGV